MSFKRNEISGKQIGDEPAVYGLKMEMVRGRGSAPRTVIENGMSRQDRCQPQHIGNACSGEDLWCVGRCGYGKMPGPKRVRVDE